ncbi:hypothetical protein TEA_029165 [Camellia sinensis var. sinensis]|uniref:Uncharacterized protein n=1 Tax=Camellia sinensis var. sinensis TaxID=542762 RepID=A0A4S4D541_CAMSN|nr:hypothetical protein TEA_029165 [Camellia sinensis var. sinensis]
MGDTPSIVVISPSPKHDLPTEYSIMEEAKPRHHQEPTMTITPPPNTFQKIVAELMGTYILVFIGCGAALVDREKTLTIVGIAMLWGLVLMVVIYTLGHISGAHVNPAVTIAFAAAQKFPLIQGILFPDVQRGQGRFRDRNLACVAFEEVPMYVLAQLLGATLACLTLRVLFNDQAVDMRPTVTQYSSSTTDLQAVILEFIISFFLMFTISGVASDHRANQGFAGIAIGATVVFNSLVAGPITGASMNPARSIGAAVISGVYKNLWVYVASPILGAMAAALAYSLLRQPEIEKSKETSKSLYNDLYDEP